MALLSCPTKGKIELRIIISNEGPSLLEVFSFLRFPLVNFLNQFTDPALHIW